MVKLLMSFYDSPDPNTINSTASPTEMLLAETLGTGPSPWRRVETTLMTTAATMRYAYDASFTPLGLNLTQASMLAYIVEFGPSTQTRIANHLGHGRAATGSAIDQLEQRGLVERLADPADRRVKLVQVTSSGLEMSEKVRELDLYLSKELRSGISRSERRALASVLNRLQLNLLRLVEEAPTEPSHARSLTNK
jgi:DNA-binding MarR family transcriptional regulator